jgi:predicted branched-subunit amino acid permease
MITGAATVGVGVGTIPALFMSVLVFAGAAQLAAVDLIEKNAPGFVIVATALIVNLRFTMYSASIAPHLRRVPLWWKGPLAYLLTDQAYVLSLSRFAGGIQSAQRPWFYFGAAFSLWITWQCAFLVGVVLGGSVPEAWSLDFAIPLTLMALLPGAVRDGSQLASVLGTVLAVTVVAGLPWNLGVMGAVVAGVVSGLVAERMGV